MLGTGRELYSYNTAIKHNPLQGGNMDMNESCLGQTLVYQEPKCCVRLSLTIEVNNRLCF